VSRDEAAIADAVERALRPLAHLDVERDGHTLVARTALGRPERVVVAGHLDTVPVNANLPSRLDDDYLHGLGSCDMKGGVAVGLRLAALLPEPNRDVTYVFYESEEIEAEHNGLGRLSRTRPELLSADFAILMEPSNAGVEAGILHGLGSCDMKGGDAVMLKLAADVTEPNRDLTFIFYEAEEVDSVYNGLRLLSESDPDLMTADFAILMEPSNASVEAGCQGTMRVDVRTTGERSHSARSWKGVNAIHKAAPILARLGGYVARQPVIDGLTYHEGLNATGIRGGVAGNVIPDECVVQVNFRFAPDRDEAGAEAFVREFFEGYDVTVTDMAAGALPGLDRPAAKAFVEAVGGEAAPKFGWTDVARFTALGVPAVNFGPGDPMFAHKQDEHVPMEHITRCERALKEWLA